MPPAAIGGIVVLPISTAPARRSRDTAAESSRATRFLNAGEPAATVMPATL